MQQEKLEKLLRKYHTGQATPEERAWLESWYLKHEPFPANFSGEQLAEDQKDSIEKLLLQLEKSPGRSYWRRFAVAASILFFIGTGVYFLLLKKAPVQHQLVVLKPSKQDVAPGGNKATLTLANGATIVLNGAQNGTLASQGNVVIHKAGDGKISYDQAKSTTGTEELIYNIATTPRGGQFQFILSDGTKVWLNSSSSIKYPVVFSGADRSVELTGEAYFEVAHNARQPFRVLSNGQTVEVLGTHFNINSYSNESYIKTTLLEGSVKITSAGGSNIIKPGEQARLKNNELQVLTVDADETVAWKNGFFNFKDDNIEAVMRQLARWYDVDVRYEGKIPAKVFSGEIPRNVNLSQILDILSFKKIHFRIEGKTIIVIP